MACNKNVVFTSSIDTLSLLENDRGLSTFSWGFFFLHLACSVTSWVILGMRQSIYICTLWVNLIHSKCIISTHKRPILNLIRNWFLSFGIWHTAFGWILRTLRIKNQTKVQKQMLYLVVIGVTGRTSLQKSFIIHQYYSCWNILILNKFDLEFWPMWYTSCMKNMSNKIIWITVCVGIPQHDINSYGKRSFHVKSPKINGILHLTYFKLVQNYFTR